MGCGSSSSPGPDGGVEPVMLVKFSQQCGSNHLPAGSGAAVARNPLLLSAMPANRSHMMTVHRDHLGGVDLRLGRRSTSLAEDSGDFTNFALFLTDQGGVEGENAASTAAAATVKAAGCGCRGAGVRALMERRRCDATRRIRLDCATRGRRPHLLTLANQSEDADDDLLQLPRPSPLTLSLSQIAAPVFSTAR